MAIHVSTDYYWIEPPQELEDKARDLAIIAALAKKINNDDLFNRAKKSYAEIYNQWDREGKAIAKKKSKTNWLGAGTEYIAKPITPWEFYYKLSEAFIENDTPDECKRKLKEMLS